MTFHRHSGPSLVFYPQSKSGVSLSHDEIGQSPPSFSCYLNQGVEYETWADIAKLDIEPEV